MQVITQYRITGTEDDQPWSTKWYNSQTEALATKWATREGAKLETRQHVETSLTEHQAMQRQGAQIVTASKHEVARMMKTAMASGKAFAAQRIAPATYKVMEVAA